MIKIRSEIPADAPAIESLTIAAFREATHTSHTEQFIVGALRNSGQLAVSLVAEKNGSIIGHVAVSPVVVSDDTPGWFGLGPISVSPEHQGQGVGSLLMERALAELRASGAAGCVVLGDPAYYTRFGFNAESTLVLPDVPAEYFLAVSFNGSLPSGKVAYHASFEAKA